MGMEEDMNLGMEDQSLKLHEIQFMDNASMVCAIEELTNERSDTTIVVYINYEANKIYIVTDGRTTLGTNRDNRRIESGGTVKLEGIKLLNEARPRFVACISGSVTASKLLKEQVIDLATTRESVSDILDNLVVTPLNDQGVVTLSGFSSNTPLLLGEVRCAGQKRGRAGKDGFFATGSGAKHAKRIFKKHCKRAFMSSLEDQEIFKRLRMCVCYSGTLDRATGGYTNEALIHERMVSFGRRYHLVYLLSQSYNYVKMSLGSGYIYMSRSLKTDAEIKSFWDDSRVKMGVNSVWIAGKCGDTIFWIFQVDGAVFRAQPLVEQGFVTDSFSSLSPERLREIADGYFRIADARSDLDWCW